MTTLSAAGEALVVAGVEVRRWPALVRGQLVQPRWPTVGELGRALASPGTVAGAPGEMWLVADGTSCDVFSAVTADELLEPDPRAAVAELLALATRDVLGLVDRVGAALRVRAEPLARALAGSREPDRRERLEAARLAALFDGAAVDAMLETALPGVRRDALDGWQPIARESRSGVTAVVAAREPALGPAAEPTGPQLRGVPTIQLHITAGNAAVVPVTSLLWGWATRGACVLKPARRTARVMGLVAAALTQIEPDHPLVRHTSIAYWPGGEDAVEEVLLGRPVFERRLIWGSDATVATVTARSSGGDLLAMRSRHAVSLIGAGADDLDLASALAAADTVVADQQACMSSLLHVVEGPPARADEYAVQLAARLAAWDELLPGSSAVRGRVLSLRRGELATGVWHANGTWPDVSSAVVRTDRPFALASHPGGRLVLVRAVPDLVRAVPDLVGPRVSHVGVAGVGAGLPDLLAALGVDNVLPLGDAEREYAGRPHDGMNVLDRLVRWVTG